MPDQRETGIWEVAVLALLRELPMHPYQMQRLLRDRHKDEILALKRGSLYHAIARLVRWNRIEAVATERDGRRPERTTYRITSAGLAELHLTLRKLIAHPRRETLEFMAAMSFLVHLTPAEAVPHLEERIRRLETEIDRTTDGLKAAAAFVERIHLVESEYLLAVLRAELDWVRKLADEIRSGTLAWDLGRILEDIHPQDQAAGLADTKASRSAAAASREKE